jgi:putative toxin-antitoxin system antitoxin component (TIGR02293 family)
MNAAPLGPRCEAAIGLLDISTLATRVFGDAERAEAWLSRPNASLCGQKPVDLAKDESGTALVRELLEQIDHGIFG